MKIFWTLFKKDLKGLGYNSSSIIQSLLMGVLMIFLLSFCLEGFTELKSELASVVFWLASFFSLMVLSRDLYQMDISRIREDLVVAGIRPQIIWLGKMCSVYILFFLTQLVFLATTIIFLDLSPEGSILRLLFLILLIDIGLVSLSCLFCSASERLQTETILVLILLPLQIPLILAGIKVNTIFFKASVEADMWVILILSCDAIFVSLSLMLFPHIYNP